MEKTKSETSIAAYHLNNRLHTAPLVQIRLPYSTNELLRNHFMQPRSNNIVLFCFVNVSHDRDFILTKKKWHWGPWKVYQCEHAVLIPRNSISSVGTRNGLKHGVPVYLYLRNDIEEVVCLVGFQLLRKSIRHYVNLPTNIWIIFKCWNVESLSDV